MDLKEIQEMAMLAGDQPMTDSRRVAVRFNKRHPTEFK